MMMSSQNDEDPFLQVQAYVIHYQPRLHSLTIPQRCPVCAEYRTATVQILSPDTLVGVLSEQP
jgi:hypothetical protein